MKLMRKQKTTRPLYWLKRVMDIIFCLLSLPLVMPLGLLLCLWIRLDSKGTAIYRQERIGHNGQPFIIYKFRTMVSNAEEILEACLADNQGLANEWRQTQKLKDDPRLTRAGRFLRKTSLDELPQLFNIIRGQMSIVGPRPIVDSEKERYGSRFAEYCEVLPGLTGLWQVSGRNNTTYAQRVALDHFYVNNWSIWLDFQIILRTVPLIFRGNGAF